MAKSRKTTSKKKSRSKKSKHIKSNRSMAKNEQLTPKLRTVNSLGTQGVTKSLLDKMVDGREFESLLQFKEISIDVPTELRKSMAEIYAVRNRPSICYLANVVSQNIKTSRSIDSNDDLPFSEMISSVPDDIKEIDVILVTGGGTGEQVAKFVEKLRRRFDSIHFIIPNIAMSAGTIFATSGEEIIMGANSYIGPIDPQVQAQNGGYIPAQSLLTLVNDIKKRGENRLKNGQNPEWSDLQILHNIDAKELGNALSASNYSIELVESYLKEYKFKSWEKHSDGSDVSEEEKAIRAKDIATDLCDHTKWKTHSRGITREVAWDICKLKITHTESIEGLDRAVRRFWALLYWIFENTLIFKIFISDYYCIFRHEKHAIIKR